MPSSRAWFSTSSALHFGLDGRQNENVMDFGSRVCVFQPEHKNEFRVFLCNSVDSCKFVISMNCSERRKFICGGIVMVGIVSLIARWTTAQWVHGKISGGQQEGGRHCGSTWQIILIGVSLEQMQSDSSSSSMGSPSPGQKWTGAVAFRSSCNRCASLLIRYSSVVAS